MGRNKVQENQDAEGANDEEKSTSTSSAQRRRGTRARRRAGNSPAALQGGSKGAKSNNPVIRYFQETSEELRKVKWPSQEETIRLTLICLAATAVSTLILGGLDFLAQELVVFALQFGG